MKKTVWMEYAKFTAAILIVLQQSISQEWVRTVELGMYREWMGLNFLFMLTRTGVPIFLMCSGIGMLGRERSIKDIYLRSIWQILKVYGCWMLVYGLFDAYSLYKSREAVFRTVINVFLKNIIFGRYHTWFLAALIGLYVVTPFLFQIFKDKRLEKYFLTLSFLFTVILPYIGKFEELSRLDRVLQDINMNFVVGYVLYFSVGFYLSRIEMTNNIKAGTVAVFSISVILAFSISRFYAGQIGQDCQKVYSEFSILGFMMSVSLLLLFRICFEKVRLEKEQLIMRIQSYGLNIYLVHPLILSFIPELTGGKVIGRAVAAWSCAVLLILLISKVPIVNRCFLRNQDRIK